MQFLRKAFGRPASVPTRAGGDYVKIELTVIRGCGERPYTVDVVPGAIVEDLCRALCEQLFGQDDISYLVSIDGRHIDDPERETVPPKVRDMVIRFYDES